MTAPSLLDSRPVIPIGSIVRLQIQTGEIKTGERYRRVYDPAPIRAVPCITLTPDGVTGPGSGGPDLLDIHHRDHRAGKFGGGKNGISILFTHHYELMRARFGPHVVDGIAGENILVDSDRQIRIEDLARGLLIETAGGPVYLHDLVIASPCVEYTRFVLGYPPDARADTTFRDALEFLGPGLRGFYARYSGEPQMLRPGDRVGLPIPLEQ